MSRLVFVRFLCLFGLFLKVHTCAVYKNTIGVTSPSHDVLLLNGTSLKINCTLFPRNYPEFFPLGTSSKNIIFRKDKSNEILDSYVHIIDNYTAQLYIETVTEEHNGFYRCSVGFPDKTRSYHRVKRVFVCGNVVKVGFPPIVIKDEDFNCVSSNWQSMTCSWIKPKNEIPTIYNLTYYFPQYGGRRSREFSCPHYKDENTCFFSSDIKKTRAVYKQSAKYYIFQLKGQNILGRSSKLYLLHHFGVVLPNKPDDPRARRIDKHSMVLEWKSPLEKYFTPNLDYELFYRSQWEPIHQWKKLRIAKKTEKKIQDLIPFTNYTVKIRCKSRDAEEEERWWSKFAVFTVRTQPDVPRTAPKFQAGMFEDHWFENSKRAITVYWEPLPKYQWNGNEFSYEIAYFSSSSVSDSIRFNSNVIRTTKFFTKVSNLDAEKSYSFIIRPINEVGMEPRIYSTLHIVKRSSLPKKPNKILAKLLLNGSYEVSWNSTENKVNSKVVSYTVFWCKRHAYGRCGEPLKWKTVRSTQTRVLMETEDSKDAFYEFAVSSNSANESSGLVWASCIITPNGGPSRVQQVKANPASPTELEINWKLDCMQQSNAIKGYYIYNCQSSNHQTCSEPLNRQFVKRKNFVLNNLQPNTMYKIMVSSVSPENEESEKSEPFVIKMPEGIPSSPDAPRITNVTNTSISVSWKHPEVLNGIIKHYVIYYNSHSIQVNGTLQERLTTNVKPFKHYHVSVTACTVIGCSKPSAITEVKTKIGVPSRMAPPRFEILNSSYVKMYWAKPKEFNGPLDVCQMSVSWREDENKTAEKNETFVPWKNKSYIVIDCSILGKDGSIYYNVSVRAGNIKDKQIFYGEWSATTKVKMCFDINEAIAGGFIIGVTFGSTIGLVLITFLSYSLTKWARQKITEANRVNIQLPKGLGDMTKKNIICSLEHRDLSNNNNTFCKNFASKEILYETDCSNLTKNRHGSGDSAYSSGSMQELMVPKHMPSIYENENEFPDNLSSYNENRYKISQSHYPNEASITENTNEAKILKDTALEDKNTNDDDINMKVDDVNTENRKHDANSPPKTKNENKDLSLIKSTQENETLSNNSMNTNTTVGFVLMNNYPDLAAYSKFGQTSWKEEISKNIVGKDGKVNGKILSSESNLADVDSGHDSDSCNNDISCASSSHYMRFGLSNSHTDLSELKLYNTFHSTACKLSKSADNIEKIQHILDDEHGERSSNFRNSPYSKFGLLNSKVQTSPTGDNINSNFITTRSTVNTGYVIIGKNNEIFAEEGCKNYKKVILPPLELKPLQMQSSESSSPTRRKLREFPPMRNVSRDSGVSISSPTMDGVSTFNGYVPNLITSNVKRFTDEEVPEKKNAPSTNERSRLESKLTSNGYIPINNVQLMFQMDDLELCDGKNLSPTSSNPSRNAEQPSGYISYDRFLNFKSTNSPENDDKALAQLNESSVWV